MAWSMMPCRPAMMFCSIVGQASRQTAGPIRPSTIERSNFLNLPPGSATEKAVYYAEPAVRLPSRGGPAMFGNQASRRVVLVAFVTALVMAAGAAAQTTWKQGHTPDGQPDLQGIWLNFDSTPFEAAIAQPAAAAPAGGGAAANVGPASEFADHNHKVSERRRAMVIDPPDGRVPVMKWAEDKRDYDLAHIPDAPEHETPWVRCITRGDPAAFFPAGYNNAYEIIQTPGYVVIVFEMIHETRII